jgi:putative ABC transport system permease protein
MIAALGIPPPTLAAWVAGGVGLLVLILLGFAAFNRVLLVMALRNIPRRRAQTALIVFGLMLASLIITASFTVGDTLSYSLQSIEMKQIGGIDEAVARQSGRTTAGAGVTDADFFTSAQAAGAIDHARSDANVDSAAGVIVAQGAVSDATTGQASSENVLAFGLPAEFDRLWGGLHSRAGGSVSVTDLAPNDVFLGNALADRLNARTGDRIQLIVQGKPTDVRVRDVLDTEVDPTIANHGPITGTVVLPLATMRTVLDRPSGFNLVYIHNRGSGGVDDLGPNGSTGQEIVRRLSGAFIDDAGAADLKAYLERPAIRAQIQRAHDQASFLDPGKPVIQQLLVEMGKPTVTDQFKALVGNNFVDSRIEQAVSQTLAANASQSDVQAAQAEVGQRLAALHVDSASATQLRDILQNPAVRTPLAAADASAPSDGPLRMALDALVAEPASGAVSAKFKAYLGSSDIRTQLRALVARAAPGQLRAYDQAANGLQLNILNPYKSDGVFFAQETGLIASAALLGVSFFSLAVGVLLIFLIFVMLAAERRAEMGMSRAVGLKRRHLTQMFLFEGLAYTLVASAVGVGLGLAVGKLMVGVISSIFTGIYKGLDLIYHVEWPTLVVALCLGVALTFVVVAVSAFRVSRLNIVAAIRDLDEGEARDRGPLRLFLSIFTNVGGSFGQLFRGHPLVFLGRLTAGTVGAVFGFLAALFRRGPLAILLGLGLAAGGLAASSEILYGAGASLLIVGAGMLVRWVLGVTPLRPALRARIGFTAAALGLLVYWGRPFGRVETLLHVDKTLQVSKLSGGPEVFALTALMVLLGAIWAVMYNSDLLIRAGMFVTGRAGNLSATTRTSMAYPMATKFRTGMAVAMFAIVTFMIAYLAIFNDVLTQNFENVAVQSGGWQLVAGTPDNNFQQNQDVTIPTDVAAAVRANPALDREVQGIGWENQARFVTAQAVHGNAPSGPPPTAQRGNAFSLHVVDDGYLGSTGYAIQPRGAGLSSDRAVWDAVRDHPGDVVIDTSVLSAQGTTPALVSGIDPNSTTFQPFQLDLSSPQGRAAAASVVPTWRVTVVGFMTRPIWDGVYMSTRTALSNGIFVPPAATTTPAATAAIGAVPPLNPTGYYFSVKPGADVNQTRLDLGRLLVKDQLEPVSVAAQQAQGTSAIVTLLNLLTGFLALGLVVGIAGLGVISTRAVVERRQQIGMMRAIGYRRSHVQRSFLMESSFIAILGLVIGGLVGLWQSYQFFVTQRTLGTVVFHVPVVELVLILVGSYAATLITTYLPARAAARVAPAEALRFE